MVEGVASGLVVVVVANVVVTREPEPAVGVGLLDSGTSEGSPGPIVRLESMETVFGAIRGP
ncbi:MAG: hypothetical protein OER95_12750 [Acidimicrobiia bacterium]|nr:hypothetical protein [Acidimicrobiia bacterium]